jgi:HAD superfamily hydrolase (TIGR01509 family)
MPPNAKQRIDCLILDLFGVIVAFDDQLVYERIAQRCSKPREAAHRMLNLVSDPDLIRGGTTLPQLHARPVAEPGLRASVQEFHAMWTASYSEPMPGMRALLRDLAGRCRLVLLSNVDREYWPTEHQSIPELDTFFAKVLSFEQGVAKPETEVFYRAVAASGCAVQHCYFVDDKPENVDAAASHGLAGHVFQNAASLRSALRPLRLLD